MAVYLGDKIVGFNNIVNNSSIITEPLTVTTNGQYNAPVGHAYSSVDVAIEQSLRTSVLRADAELIRTYSDDFLAVQDENITIKQPYDTTSRTPLAGGARLTTTTSNGVAVDLDNYDYLVLQRALTIPIYNTTSIAKGRQEYQIQVMRHQLFNSPTAQLKAIVNNQSYTSASASVGGSYVSRLLYWSSGTALGLYTGLSYGVLQSLQAPTITSNRIILKSPSIIVRGYASYLASTFYNALTDIRAQYIIDIYRAPKGHLNVNGWGFLDDMTKVIQCTNTTNHTLV